MPRRTRSREAKPRREEILESATQLFAERGYEGTSMGDLAARVGMRKASLFYHFASKEILYGEVLERTLDSVGAAVTAADEVGGSPAERLDRISEALTRALAERPFAARLLIREALEWRTSARPTRAAAALGAALAWAEEFVREGQARGVFAAGDAKQLMLTLVSMHVLPFGLGGDVAGGAGIEPVAPSFVVARAAAVRDQAHALLSPT